MEIEKQTIRVGSRGSQLALVQVDEIKDMFAQKNVQIDFDHKIYDTLGDKDKKTPLTVELPGNFFTDTLDRALLDEEIDIAIHSAKDLSESLTPGLSIFALTASVDETDAFVGKDHFDQLKPGAKIGTSSPLRKQHILDFNLELNPTEIRGNIQERLSLVENGTYDGAIIATAALKRLGLHHHIKDIMPWETTPLQGQLAVVGRSNDVELAALFKCIDVRLSYGDVYLIGAGPGDPELITLKGINTLKKVDCIFYDFLAHKDILNHALQAEKIYAGKRKGKHSLAQSELSKQLRDQARAGKTVARLKGGDPLIFGRGAEEINYLRSYHINTKVIPGVSSATSIPSGLGVPLTARDVSSSVAFVSGHGKNETSSEQKLIDIPSAQTIVFLMGLTKLDEILQSLDHAGWSQQTPIIVISRGTRVDERIVIGSLNDIKAKVDHASLKPPALIVVGETVKFYQEHQSKKENILYTGTNPEKYKALGQVVHIPMIEIHEVSFDPMQVASLKAQLATCRMILLTSRFAVRSFFNILKKNQISDELLKKKDFIVIGKDTNQALVQEGFNAALVSDIETSEGLFDQIKLKIDVKGQHILFPRSSLPNPFLKEALTEFGAFVEELTVYQNTPSSKQELPKDIKKVIFTSPSTVQNFLNNYQNIPADWQILSKGPLTSKSLEEAGYRSEVLVYE